MPWLCESTPTGNLKPAVEMGRYIQKSPGVAILISDKPLNRDGHPDDYFCGSFLRVQ
jgi:hypothetical protein